jgi:hypothetical protein
MCLRGLNQLFENQFLPRGFNICVPEKSSQLSNPAAQLAANGGASFDFFGDRGPKFCEGQLCALGAGDRNLSAANCRRCLR